MSGLVRDSGFDQSGEDDFDKMVEEISGELF